jgi:hypothetical protein
MNPLQAFDRWKTQLSQRPIDAWFVASMLGFAMAAAAYYVGVGVVRFDGQLLNGIHVAGYGVEKEVGYLAALNWSLGGALLVPAIVVCSLNMHAAMAVVLQKLADRSMARTQTEFKVVTASELTARWKHDRALGLLIPFVAGATAGVFVLLGWVTEVVIPSLRGIASPDMLTIGSDAEEYDWSIACLMNNGHHVAGGCYGSLAFSLVAYFLIPVFTAAYGFSCVIDAVRFVAFACGGTRRSNASSGASGERDDWVLVASPDRADDPFCGFGAFEPFLTPLLGVVFFILISLFLMITQNTYLRDPNSHNIWEFFSQDFFGGISAIVAVLTGALGPAAAFGHLFTSDKGVSLLNPKTVFGLFTFFFFVILSLAAAMLLVRRTAHAARGLGIERAPELAAETGVAETVVRARLEGMKFWPLTWMSQRTTITVIVFMSLALLSFRLALFPIAIGLLVLARGMFEGYVQRRGRAKQAVPKEQAVAQPIAVSAALSGLAARPRSPAGINLFISYRRTDTEVVTGRIRDNMAMRFGESSIFMDIDSIPFGLDFRDQIRAALDKSDVVLAIIGRGWSGQSADGSARIREDSDPVRFEIEMALARSIPTIPVLVQGARMPAVDELPPGLTDFSFRNAITIDGGRDFHVHLDRLIRAIELAQGGRREAAPPTP